jgi:hypothetical protein
MKQQDTHTHTRTHAHTHTCKGRSREQCTKNGFGVYSVLLSTQPDLPKPFFTFVITSKVHEGDLES